MRDIPEIMVQYDILNKKIAEINLHRESPDLSMKRKEQLLRKNYYRQYISRQDSASQRRQMSYEKPLLSPSVQTPQQNLQGSSRQVALNSNQPVHQHYGRQIFSSQSTPKYSIVTRAQP
jgi:hypothetical protein